MKKSIAVAAAVLILCLAVGFFPVHGETEIYDSVVRLHVLANSDSAEDQAVKLKVRDEILSVTSSLLSDCRSREEAAEVLNANLDLLRQTAEEVLLREGFDETVSVTLGEEEYPERRYDAVCFPSGSYLSLRILIGNAEGQNWWCCLFPPLCLGAATVSKSDAEDAFIEVGLTPSQYRVITETDKPVYKVRFKLLELFGK